MFRTRQMPWFAALCFTAACAGDGAAPEAESSDAAMPADADVDGLPQTVDPGTGPWKPVPKDKVREVCGLDPDALAAADASLGLRWSIVRHGRLCHDFYPSGDHEKTVEHVFSATKTKAAAVLGALMYASRDQEKSGPRTGPLGEFQRVDEWLDVEDTSFQIHPDATIAHVLAMVGYSDDLSFGSKVHSYDGAGMREINALSDIANNVIAQDKKRFGKNLEEFTQRSFYDKLGMTDSTWTDGAPDKDFSISWNTTIRDMLRVGLLINNGGVWNGERLLDSQYVYNMIHPAFEDGNTAYGYLTWLNAADYRPQAVGEFLAVLGITNPFPEDGCAPLALHRSYPHGLSEATECGYTDASGYTCEQQFDVGVWSAQGLNGNYITGHRGLDMVLVIQNFGTQNLVPLLWDAVRPAVVAEDPVYQGDEEAFCEAYAAGDYAPDLQLWQGGL